MDMTTLQAQIAGNSSEVKRSKTPQIFIIQKGVSQNVQKACLVPLFEGLKHLKVNIVETADELEGLTQADMAIFLTEDKELLVKAWENGAIPVTAKFSDKIADYNPNTESGNAFVFENVNHWEIFAAIVRATETYKFPYDWKFILRSCKKSV